MYMCINRNVCVYLYVLKYPTGAFDFEQPRHPLLLLADPLEQVMAVDDLIA